MGPTEPTNQLKLTIDDELVYYPVGLCEPQQYISDKNCHKEILVILLVTRSN